MQLKRLFFDVLDLPKEDIPAKILSFLELKLDDQVKSICDEHDRPQLDDAYNRYIYNLKASLLLQP